MASHDLRKVLAQLGYGVVERDDTWAECFVTNDGERWRGRGVSREDALADAMAQMLPSSLAWRLLEGYAASHPGDRSPAVEAAPVSTVSAPLRTRGAARTDAGATKDHVPDASLCLPARGLVAVVDGMKATAVGATAARLALAAFAATFEAATALSPMRMRGLPVLLAAVQRANKDVVEAQKRDPKLKAMTASLGAALVVGAQVAVLHVGTARVYRLRGTALELLAGDAAKKPDKAKGDAGAKAKAAVRTLGADKTIEAEASIVSVEAGDVVLVCSDGLCASLSEAAIAEVLARLSDPDEAVAALAALVHEKGGTDPSTAAVLRLDEG